MEFTFLPKDDEENDYSPPTDKPGRILLNVHTVTVGSEWAFEADVLDQEDNSAVFWIEEGLGIDDWLNLYCDFREPGYYVIEGITVFYTRSYEGETDEEWEYTGIRPATPREIETGCLND